MGKLIEVFQKFAEYYSKNFPQICEIINAFKGTGQLVVKAKEAVAAESLFRSLREIYQCYTKLVDEIQRAESTKYSILLLKPMKEVTHLSLAAI